MPFTSPNWFRYGIVRTEYPISVKSRLVNSNLRLRKANNFSCKFGRLCYNIVRRRCKLTSKGEASNSLGDDTINNGEA